ncbi:MAG: CBS domain-containing protein [marine benthic group bacterium]|jgi:CBS domain-containing protein|nr:CBS domain-containing protein [Candidatus Benthicola marisminoris]
MRISDVLERKGGEVVTVPPDGSVHAAMKVLVGNNVGSVIVVDGESPVGILTERDVLRLGAADPASLTGTRVSDAMTRDLVVATPGDLVEYAAGVMTSNRIRHLPIIDGGRLVGVLSIGDVVKAMKQEKEVENRYLRDYIQGAVR